MFPAAFERNRKKKWKRVIVTEVEGMLERTSYNEMRRFDGDVVWSKIICQSVGRKLSHLTDVKLLP